MKHLKKFGPGIGDYVIIKLNNNRKGGIDKKDMKIFNMINYLENNIGTIVNCLNLGNVFEVKFEIDNFIRKFSRSEIIHHSKNKKDLETILSAKKYNI